MTELDRALGPLGLPHDALAKRRVTRNLVSDGVWSELLVLAVESETGIFRDRVRILRRRAGRGDQWEWSMVLIPSSAMAVEPPAPLVLEDTSLIARMLGHLESSDQTWDLWVAGVVSERGGWN